MIGEIPTINGDYHIPIYSPFIDSYLVYQTLSLPEANHQNLVQVAQLAVTQLWDVVAQTCPVKSEEFEAEYYGDLTQATGAKVNTPNWWDMWYVYIYIYIHT